MTKTEKYQNIAENMSENDQEKVKLFLAKVKKSLDIIDLGQVDVKNMLAELIDEAEDKTIMKDFSDEFMKSKVYKFLHNGFFKESRHLYPGDLGDESIPIVKADENYVGFGLRIAGFVSGIFLLAFYLRIMVETKESLLPYLHVIVLITMFLVIPGFLLMIKSLKSISKFDGLEINKDRLEVKSIFGTTKKIIYLKEIISWTEVVRTLSIYTKNSEYSILSSFYKNYPLIRIKLIRGKKLDEKKQLELKHYYFFKDIKLITICGLIISAAFIYGSFYNYATKDIGISKENLTIIEQVVSSISEAYDEGCESCKKQRSVNIKFQKKYPDFNFKIEEDVFEPAQLEDILANVKGGDNLFVDIKTEEYKLKLTGVKPERPKKDFYTVSVIGLRDNTKSYLTLSDYNKYLKSRAVANAWDFGLVGLVWIFVVFSLRYLLKTGGFKDFNQNAFEIGSKSK